MRELPGCASAQEMGWLVSTMPHVITPLTSRPLASTAEVSTLPKAFAALGKDRPRKPKEMSLAAMTSASPRMPTGALVSMVKARA